MSDEKAGPVPDKAEPTPEIDGVVCAITKGHCHLQGVRRNAQRCTAVCDLADGVGGVCVHCGAEVVPTDHDGWIHANNLSRCQSTDVAYGHLAHPAGVLCRADGPNPCLGARKYPDRLRAGAAAIRAAVGDDAFVMPLIAEGLDNDAKRLDRGEPVADLTESLALADSFTEEASDV